MKELLNYRYYILLFLSGVALTMTFGGCSDEIDVWNWLGYQIASKFVALAAWFVAYKLIDYWNFHNEIPLITNLTKLANKILSDERN